MTNKAPGDGLGKATVEFVTTDLFTDEQLKVSSSQLRNLVATITPTLLYEAVSGAKRSLEQAVEADAISPSQQARQQAVRHLFETAINLFNRTETINEHNREAAATIASLAVALEPDTTNDQIRGLFYGFVKDGTGANQLEKVLEEIRDDIAEHGSDSHINQLVDEVCQALEFSVSDQFGFNPSRSQRYRLRAVVEHFEHGFDPTIARGLFRTHDIQNRKVDSLTQQQLVAHGRWVRAVSQSQRS